MSLILEALRKSEAERQIGRAPGLMTPTLAPPRSPPRWPYAVAAVVLLGGVAATAWWLGRHATTTLQLDGPAPATSASNIAPATATSPPASPSASAARPVRDKRTPTRAAVARPGDTAGAAASPPAPTRSPAPTPPAASVSPPASASNMAAAASPSGHRDESATPAAAAPAEASIDYARIDQMEPAERALLPSLRMSVHVFADQPAQRFAVIDGQRVSEGATLGNDLQVHSIRRDGVLLAHAGRTWLLARDR